MQSYRRNSRFIPLLSEEKLDKLSLRRIIPEIEKKIVWLDLEINKVKKIKNFNGHRVDITKLKRILKRLLFYKEKYYDYKDKNLTLREKIKDQSRDLLVKFERQMIDFFEKISFLRSYGYPVNHLELRRKYDLLKKRKDLKSKQKANEIYLYRRIAQDGTWDRRRIKKNIFFRANLDTIQYNFGEVQDFISEDLRFDISSALEKIDKSLRSGPRKKLAGLQEWKQRTQETLKFYKLLLKNEEKDRNIGSFSEDKKWISSVVQATRDLKDFNFQKQSQVYAFWKEYSDLWQAIFVIETILFNEVGRLDQKSGLEKRDIAQVVINRYGLPEYNRIPSNDEFYSYLYPSLVQKDDAGMIAQNPWPNVLFKKGEFSFTYFFLAASLKVFCPDMSRAGRRLRRKNVQLALELLQRPNDVFQGVRYFSRGAMLGRIDMGRLWKDFVAIPERPGRKVASVKELTKKYQRGEYSYRYHFSNNSKRLYKAIEIQGEDYVLDPSTMEFFEYRNPHHFRYFKAK